MALFSARGASTFSFQPPVPGTRVAKWGFPVGGSTPRGGGAGWRSNAAGAVRPGVTGAGLGFPNAESGFAGSLSKAKVLEVEPPKVDDDTTKEESRTRADCVRLFEVEIRSIVKRLLSNEEDEMASMDTYVEETIASVLEKDKNKVIDREIVLVAKMAERATYLRRAVRGSCSKHKWTRTVEPESVKIGDVFDMCDECSSWCGSTFEERCFNLDMKREFGVAGSDELAENRESARTWTCCDIE
jgi:hypothetical protein